MPLLPKIILQKPKCMNLNAHLNNSQVEAVESLDGPLLILAGAGSGKTRVLTYRIANLVLQGKASPESILAVTFTNKAAQEMKHRALQILDKFGVTYYNPPWVSTFHSFCSGVLRSDIYKLGYDRNFTIYDRADQLSLIKKNFDELNIDTKAYSAKVFLARINDSKTQNISPHSLKDTAVHSIDELVADVYLQYEKRMKDANALDFEDLLIKTIELFENHSEVLEKYNQMLKYILVDEYQDTNPTQYKIIRLLAKAHRNLCAVGDEDQSIYSWRGADIQNILSFENDFPETKVIKLEENYRSSGTIVKAASSLIQNNTTRKEKVLYTKNQMGEKISIREMPDEYAEARWVVQNIINKMKSDNYAYNDFAVFYRTNAQSRVVEEELRSNRIPYQIIGGVKFYDRMEIKDLIGYLRLLINPKDDIALLRVLNVPSRGIGKTSEKKLLDYALENNITLLEAIHMLVQKNHPSEKIFTGGVIKKLESFLTLIVSLQTFIQSQKPSEVFTSLLDQTKYVDYLKAEKPEDASARIDNVNELLNAISQFEQERGEEGTLANFLEQIALVSDIDELNDENKCVKLMTLHISKGLEFPVVFVIGAEEGLFPSAQAIDSLDPLEIEEERRLAYVGMTRAKSKLYITFARKRRQWGQEQFNAPSRFLKEVPQEFIEASTTFTQPKRPAHTFNPDQFQYDNFPDYENGDSSLESEWKRGTKVRHPTFGIGTIYKTEGTGEEQKVIIMFPNNSLKKFILKYARLERA